MHSQGEPKRAQAWSFYQERNLKGGRPERDKTIFAKFERYRVLDASLLKEVIDAHKR